MEPHQYDPSCSFCQRDFPNGEGWMVGYDVLHVTMKDPQRAVCPHGVQRLYVCDRCQQEHGREIDDQSEMDG